MGGFDPLTRFSEAEAIPGKQSRLCQFGTDKSDSDDSDSSQAIDYWVGGASGLGARPLAPRMAQCHS